MNVVHFFKLSPNVRDGLMRYADTLGADAPVDTVDLHRVWWDLNEFCGLWFRLKLEPDAPHLFPEGKGATLRIMEMMIEDAIKRPIDIYGTPNDRHTRGQIP
jgi:hypothetical protein